MQVTHFHQPDLSVARDSDLDMYSLMPLSWYERTWLYAGIGILAGLLLQIVIWQVWGYVPPLWLSFLAALCYTAGFLFDVGATHLHVRQKHAFEERGLRMPTREANPLLPDYPTLMQQIFNTTTLLSLLYILLVIAMPGVGFGAAMLHGFAGLGNYRVYRRSSMILQLFDSRMQDNFLSEGGGQQKRIERHFTDALRDLPQGRRELTPIIKKDDENAGPSVFQTTRTWTPV